jgi:NhaA family Na+:H+ antiporter
MYQFWVVPSLRQFFLSLAIFDDVGVILVVAVGFGDAPSWAALGLAALGLVAPLGATLIGISFTMSLFIAGLAYTQAMLEGAKLAFLAASVVSAADGLLMLVWVTAKSPNASRAAGRC